MTDKSNANYDFTDSRLLRSFNKRFCEHFYRHVYKRHTKTPLSWRRLFVRHVSAIKGRRGGGGPTELFIGKQLLQVCSRVKRRKFILVSSWQPLKVISLMPRIYRLHPFNRSEASQIAFCFVKFIDIFKVGKMLKKNPSSKWLRWRLVLRFLKLNVKKSRLKVGCSLSYIIKDLSYISVRLKNI